MNQQNNTGLAINEEVIAKMAEMAALEVEGVAGMVARPLEVKSLLRRTGSKSVRVEAVNGVVNLDVYICVRQSAQVKTVAEAVQRGVKEKIQGMTGSAITRVNVHVSDIELETSAEAEPEV